MRYNARPAGLTDAIRLALLLMLLAASASAAEVKGVINAIDPTLRIVVVGGTNITVPAPVDLAPFEVGRTINMGNTKGVVTARQGRVITIGGTPVAIPPPATMAGLLVGQTVTITYTTAGGRNVASRITR
jgi:hypothetical protein